MFLFLLLLVVVTLFIAIFWNYRNINAELFLPMMYPPDPIKGVLKPFVIPR